MIAPDELEKKTNISYGLIAAIIIAAFSLGGTVATLVSQVGKIQHVEDTIYKAQKETEDYTTQEVGGLRSDWERRNSDVERRLQNLEKYHVKE